MDAGLRVFNRLRGDLMRKALKRATEKSSDQGTQRSFLLGKAKTLSGCGSEMMLEEPLPWTGTTRGEEAHK